MNKIYIICGLIGSGKTTFCKKHFKFFTDLDEMPLYSSKKDQLLKTIQLSDLGDVAHITTFPTNEEMHFIFEHSNCELVLINTSESQALTNILVRARKRDLNNLGEVINANRRMAYLFRKNKHKFKIIKFGE